MKQKFDDTLDWVDEEFGVIGVLFYINLVAFCPAIVVFLFLKSTGILELTQQYLEGKHELDNANAHVANDEERTKQ